MMDSMSKSEIRQYLLAGQGGKAGKAGGGGGGGCC